jgi:trehalose 6-phosphate phosphatase
MLKTLPLPTISEVSRIALFLDFDGTIVEIAERPHQVRVDPATRELLSRLTGRLDGALAVVSGRPIADIDRLFSPLVLPIAGVHGLMRRDATGRMLGVAIDPAIMAPVRTALELALPDLLIEEKPGAVAVHYRLRPELGRMCYEAVSNVIASRSDLELVQGKMVLEIKLKGASKGTAIAAFMDEPPFRGRLPVFAGDDVTDENGFAVVEAMGGHAIKVGNGTTRARWRVETAAELIDWLGALAAAEE